MNRTVGAGLALMCAVVFGLAGSASAAILLVDDFNRGEKPNALGGDFGAWDKDEADPTQSCVSSFDKANAYGGVGYALRLDYDVDSPNPAYNGFWMKLEGIDLTTYKNLVLYVKGDVVRGHTSQFKLELKNGRETGKFLLQDVTGQWQRLSVPLAKFSGLTNWSSMTEFVVVFDDINATQKVGTIYLDEISFEN